MFPRFGCVRGAGFARPVRAPVRAREIRPALAVAFRCRMAWVNITGLVLDLIGALVLTRVLILTRNQAVELGVTRVAGDTLEQI